MPEQTKTAAKTIKIPGPDHPITIERNPNRIVVSVAGRVVADTRDALTLREAAYPAVQYIPRKDVDMALLQRTEHSTYCPYKGDCAYFSIPLGGERSTNAVWTYEAPYAAVVSIKDHLAFYPDRVDAIEERPETTMPDESRATSSMSIAAPSVEPAPARRMIVVEPPGLKLYHAPTSPNSRRVRLFLAEKGISVPLVSIDLGAGEQNGAAYRAINPRRVVPTLVLEDGTAIGEVLAIWRYLEETYPAPPLLGTTPKDKALVTMWERRAELEGFAAVMEGVRNAAQRLAGRAIAGPHDYAQIPELIDRSRRRVTNFYSDMDVRLAEAAFVAGHNFSAADITTLVTVDFATRAFDMPIPTGNAALKRWYDAVATRPSAGA